MEDCLPFHSGIFHIPYQNFCSIPYPGARPPPYKNVTNDKNDYAKPIVSLVSVFFFFFVLHFSSATYTRITVISNNISIDDQEARTPQCNFLPTILKVKARRNSVFLF